MSLNGVRTAAVGAVVLFGGWQQVEANCKVSRRDYEVYVWNEGSLPPNAQGAVLYGDNDKSLKCVLELKPTNDDGGLCATADHQSHFFGISVINQCDREVTARVKIKNDASYPITFKKSGKNCKDALEKEKGLEDKVKKGGDSLDVFCKTDKYAPDPNVDNPRATYAVEIVKVGGDDVRKNGLFDPEIVVERGGGHVLFDMHALGTLGWKLVVLLLGLMALAMFVSVKLGRAIERLSPRGR